MNTQFRITIASPPDRKNLVAEIFFGDEQVAELNRESDSIRVEIHAPRRGGPWVLPFRELVETLQHARRKLEARYE